LSRIIVIFCVLQIALSILVIYRLPSSESENLIHSEQKRSEALEIQLNQNSCDLAISDTEPVPNFTYDEIRRIIREELKLSNSQQINTSIAQTQSNLGDIEKYENLSYQLDDMIASGNITDDRIERLLYGLKDLNKEQRKDIRQKLSRSINSGQVKVIN
jgi:hypothetical protein